jgi:hypothetical protein
MKVVGLGQHQANDHDVKRRELQGGAVDGSTTEHVFAWSARSQQQHGADKAGQYND